MRDLAVIVPLGVLLVTGCRHKHASEPEAAFTPVPTTQSGTNRPSSTSSLIVTPEAGLQGKVMRTNPAGKFVVLNFPIGHLPSLEQRLSVYRLGLKVGEVRVTGPQLDDNIVGDVVAGEAAVGDVVRDH
jgi:hypothetical protein